MDNNRCGSCGFLNFAFATDCKRCKASLQAHAEGGESGLFDGRVPEWPEGSQPNPYPQYAYQPPYLSSPLAALPRASKHAGTNALLIALLCGAVMVAAGIGVAWKFGKRASSHLGWQEYQASDGSFSVLMPSEPVESVQTIPSPAGPLEMHVSMADMKATGGFVAAYVDYPVNGTPVSAQAILDASADGAVRNSRATLLSKKNITLDGHPGVELEMLPPAGEAPGGARATARIYWVSPRLYITFAGGLKSPDLDTTLATFHNSFKLKNRS